MSVEVLTPNSAERRSTIKGPNDIPPKSNGPILKTSQDGANTTAPGISLGPLIVNSINVSLAGKTIAKSPTNEENNSKRERERHQIRGGNKLQNVIKRRIIAAEILQVELAKIGLNKNIKIQMSLILGSITRSQPDLPETY